MAIQRAMQQAQAAQRVGRVREALDLLQAAVEGGTDVVARRAARQQLLALLALVGPASEAARHHRATLTEDRTDDQTPDPAAWRTTALAFLAAQDVPSTLALLEQPAQGGRTPLRALDLLLLAPEVARASGVAVARALVAALRAQHLRSAHELGRAAFIDGRLAEAAGDDASAVACWEPLVVEGRADAGVIDRLTGALERLGRHAEALAHLDRWLARARGREHVALQRRADRCREVLATHGGAGTMPAMTASSAAARQPSSDAPTGSRRSRRGRRPGRRSNHQPPSDG